MTSKFNGITTRQIRAYVLRTVERCRITRDGEIHAYGIMPNTNKIGWYLLGFDNDIAGLIAEERTFQAGVE